MKVTLKKKMRITIVTMEEKIGKNQKQTKKDIRSMSKDISELEEKMNRNEKNEKK